MSEKKRLFEEFPPVSTEKWMNKISADLKGADFNEKLIWKTAEGFDVKPFYRSEDVEHLLNISAEPGEFPYIRGAGKNGNNWLIRQNIDVEDYRFANSKAQDILTKGVDSLGFEIPDPESITEKNIETLLNGINLDEVEINFHSNGKAREIIDYFIKSARKNNCDLSKIRGTIEADPLGRLMTSGKLCIPLGEGLEYLTALTRDASILPYYRTILVNGSTFTNTGKEIVKELGLTLSMANEYMNQLTERGITSDVAASRISFCFGTGSNYFFEIAKLRAARFLWSVIVSAYKTQKSSSAIMKIHCITSRWNKRVEDPHTNLLRTQTEAMSAILGGTDSLTVEPFDIIFRHPDEFSERIARNQQLILKEEAYFDKVADPAGGSYYVEKLTSLIADSAWKLFIQTEEQGGFIEALNKEYFNSLIS